MATLSQARQVLTVIVQQRNVLMQRAAIAELVCVAFLAVSFLYGLAHTVVMRCDPAPVVCAWLAALTRTVSTPSVSRGNGERGWMPGRSRNRFSWSFSTLRALAPFVMALVLRSQLGTALGSRYRGEMYPHTMATLLSIRAKGDELVNHPSCPSLVRTLYQTLRGALIRLGSPSMEQRPA